MSEQQNESEQDTDSFEYHAQVTQHPTTLIEGDIADIKTGADIDDSKESNDATFGVVIEDPEVVGGSVWKNNSIPDGFASVSEYNDTIRLATEGTDNDYVRGREVTEDTVEDARERLDDAGVDYEDADYDDLAVSGTDYKVADEDDQEANIGYNSDGEQTGIDVGGGEFESEEVDGFDADTIMVWYGGMAGQFVGRALDFNGMPWARVTPEGDYLVKGLFQVPLGWRGDADVEDYDANVESTDRSKLAKPTDDGGLGRPPRVARPPVLRSDLDGRSFIGIGRYQGGRMHEVHVGRATDDYDAVLAELQSDDGDVEDEYDRLEMKYTQDAEEVLSDEFDNPSEVYALYEGDGWPPVGDPDFMQSDGDDGGSFDIEGPGDGDVEHPTDEEQEFGQMVSEKLAGTDAEPSDEVFGGNDLEGLVEANSENFDQEYDVDAIRGVVVDNTEHL